MAAFPVADRHELKYRDLFSRPRAGDEDKRAAARRPPVQWKSTPQGAATSVWAAVVAPADEIGGKYCEDCHVGAITPDDVPTSAMTEGVRGYAIDPKNAEALWKKSEELVKESF